MGRCRPHYEPHEFADPESAVQATGPSPVHKVWAPGKPYNKLVRGGSIRSSRTVITTYRASPSTTWRVAMSRWLPWLAELQPELFIELGHDLAKENGIKNLDWCGRVEPSAAHISARKAPGHASHRRDAHRTASPIHTTSAALALGLDGLLEQTGATGVNDPDVLGYGGIRTFRSHEGKAFRLQRGRRP